MLCGLFGLITEGRIFTSDGLPQVFVIGVNRKPAPNLYFRLATASKKLPFQGINYIVRLRELSDSTGHVHPRESGSEKHRFASY